jgi:hypothetical protein
MFQSKLFVFTTLLAFLFSLPAEILAQRKSRKKRGTDNREQVLINNLKQHVAILAHDSLEGRRTGTPGEEKAVRYITTKYTQMGIAAAGTQGYVQPFEIFEGMEFRKSTLRINDKTLQAGSDFLPMPWSGLGGFSSEAVVALNESGEAWWIDAGEILEKNKENPHFMLGPKLHEVAIDAAQKGAKAVIFYNGGLEKDGIKSKYLPRDREKAASIPVYHVSKAAFDKLGLNEESETILQGTVQLEEAKRIGTNVAALIDNGAPLTVVIGAHLDHLGYGEDENSRHAGSPAIHNGADDNASGTAAVLELARLLKEKQDKKFNYLYLHFSGEELGLYGSKYFAENPTIDLKKVSYMINLDMVGRLNDSSKSLTVGGVGTSPTWPNVLKPTADFSFKVDSSGTGPSDHTSFYRKDIPVLFFFTGLHTDYHKPSDDAELINYNGMAKIVSYIDNLIGQTPADNQLAFTKTREQSMGSRGFKVSIGIMPDYTFSGTGVKADGVVDGRPAQKAGLKANDIILQLGDHLIVNVDTYMQALNRFEKGQSTTIVVKRGTEVMQMPITF